MLESVQTIGTAVILANIVSFAEAITSLWKHGTINRRKQMVLLVTQCIFCTISYFLLGTYASMGTNLFAIFKYLFILYRHPEGKIKLGNIENIVLGLPYILIAIICFKHDGWLGIMYGILGFLDDSRYWLKSDKTKQLASIGIESFYVMYNMIVMNYVTGIKQIIIVIINIVNVYRIHKHGEEYYYKHHEKVNNKTQK